MQRTKSVFSNGLDVLGACIALRLGQMVLGILGVVLDHHLVTRDLGNLHREQLAARRRELFGIRVVFSFTKKEISTRQGQYLFLFNNSIIRFRVFPSHMLRFLRSFPVTM